MIPCLGNVTAEHLEHIIDGHISQLTSDELVNMPLTLLDGDDPITIALGIEASGSPDLTVIVTDPDRPIGKLRVHAAAHGCVIIFDNRDAAGTLYGNIRLAGHGSAVIFAGLGDAYVAMHDVLLRSPEQLLFWGRGATAVGCSIELEGEGKAVAIGDDALLSAGIWIRNHDMHSVHDLATGTRINRPPVDVFIEPHVWIGQNAMLLGCPRIGAGSIVGAQALVKSTIARKVAVGGVPARVIRSNVSWGRDINGMTDAECRLLDALPSA